MATVSPVVRLFDSTGRPRRTGAYGRDSDGCSRARQGSDVQDAFSGLIRSPFRWDSIDIRATSTIIELFHRGERVASHRRSYGPKGTPVTAPEHRPKCHEDYGQWPPERMTSWAAKFGCIVEEVVRRKLSEYPYPEMGYRAVLGILRCAEKHGAKRMDAACQRALAATSKTAPHRRYIEAILKRGLDKASPVPAPSTRCCGLHENVRGRDYYNKETNE